MATTTSTPDLSAGLELAKQIYLKQILPQLRPEDQGRHVAVAIPNGEYEVDADDYQAGARLLERVPSAAVFTFMTRGLSDSV